jgi:hypothetical protein
MKQYLALLILLSLSVATTSGALASVVNEGAIENESQDLKIPLSSNKLDTELSVEQTQRERAERPTGAIEFGVSSWEPNNLQPPSRINNNVSSFGLAGPPALALSFIEPGWRDVSWVGGLQFLELSRSGTLDSAGFSDSETQTAYVPSLRLGLQYAPIKFSSKLFRPYVSAAILPTAVITGRSSFDDGEADFGVAGEAGAGALIHVSSLFDLNLNVTGVVGKVSSSSLNGLGVGAGVRVGL